MRSCDFSVIPGIKQSGFVLGILSASGGFPMLAVVHWLNPYPLCTFLVVDFNGYHRTSKEFKEI